MGIEAAAEPRAGAAAQGAPWPLWGRALRAPGNPWGPAGPGAMRMASLALLLLLVAAVASQEQAQTTDWRATLKTIRNGVHKIGT